MARITEALEYGHFTLHAQLRDGCLLDTKAGHELNTGSQQVGKGDSPENRVRHNDDSVACVIAQ